MNGDEIFKIDYYLKLQGSVVSPLMGFVALCYLIYVYIRYLILICKFDGAIISVLDGDLHFIQGYSIVTEPWNEIEVYTEPGDLHVLYVSKGGTKFKVNLFFSSTPNTIVCDRINAIKNQMTNPAS